MNIRAALAVVAGVAVLAAAQAAAAAGGRFVLHAGESLGATLQRLDAAAPRQRIALATPQWAGVAVPVDFATDSLERALEGALTGLDHFLVHPAEGVIRIHVTGHSGTEAHASVPVAGTAPFSGDIDALLAMDRPEWHPANAALPGWNQRLDDGSWVLHDPSSGEETKLIHTDAAGLERIQNSTREPVWVGLTGADGVLEVFHVVPAIESEEAGR